MIFNIESHALVSMRLLFCSTTMDFDLPSESESIVWDYLKTSDFTEFNCSVGYCVVSMNKKKNHRKIAVFNSITWGQPLSLGLSNVQIITNISCKIFRNRLIQALISNRYSYFQYKPSYYLIWEPNERII